MTGFLTGVVRDIFILALVIGVGLFLGKIKIKGVSIGATWILFLGIIASHFGLIVSPATLAFVKDFGLIIFVFSIGLQVGPGFFHSFASGGLKLNLMSLLLIVFGVGVTIALSAIFKEDLSTMTGVMSGAVTNTPGLGAAQQTLVDASGADPDILASAYAVAYPLGVLGVILVLILAKAMFKVDIRKEKAALDDESGAEEQARRMHCQVENPAVFGRNLAELMKDMKGDFVVSRIMHGDEISIPGPDTVLNQGDKLLIVTTQKEVEGIRILFGEEIPMHVSDWIEMDHVMTSRKVTVTKSSLTGRKLGELNIRAKYGVSVTRVRRAGIDLVARPNLYLQMGDRLHLVGPSQGLDGVSELVGNTDSALNKPNLIPIFLGIVCGVLFGSIPFHFPGIPQPVKLGLAGGPLIIAILVGYFGPKWRVTTYTTTSANLMIREIGLSLFLAAVGLGAGEGFVSAIVGGGYWWILYGFIITVVPCLLVAIIARYALKINFLQICGLIAGGMTNPIALGFAQNSYGEDYISVSYASVYPLTMFMRVLAAQILILIALA